MSPITTSAVYGMPAAARRVEAQVALFLLEFADLPGIPEPSHLRRLDGFAYVDHVDLEIRRPAGNADEIFDYACGIA